MTAAALSGYLDIDGTRLEYAWHGPGPEVAPTLVFLHEGLGCVAMWKTFPSEVAAETGCGALVYSRAGYGGSDPVELPRPVTYLHHEAEEVLPRVLDAAGVREAVLIGHSDGASISLIYAGGTHDTRVRGVVAMAPHVFHEELCYNGVAATKTIYETTNLRERLARYHGANVDVAFRGWNDTWLDPDFWHWNIESYLPNISVPVLVMQGQNDQYGSFEQVDAIERQTGGPVYGVMLPECRHAPHQDQPDLALEAIAEFVGEALNRAAPGGGSSSEAARAP